MKASFYSSLAAVAALALSMMPQSASAVVIEYEQQLQPDSLLAVAQLSAEADTADFDWENDSEEGALAETGVESKAPKKGNAKNKDDKDKKKAA